MQTLQIRVEAILRVAIAIGRQRRRLDAIGVAAHRGPSFLDGLVNVVAEEQDELGIFVGEVPIGGKVAVFVIGAGDKAEAQCFGRGIRRRQSRCTTNAAGRVTAHEAIPIGPPGLQPSDVEMNRIRECLLGGRFASPHHIAQRRVGGDFVADGDLSPPRMPPGVCGLGDNGSGASRVHSTKPSARGAPEATPRLKGSPARQPCAQAWRSKAGAAMAPKPALAAARRRWRRVGRMWNSVICANPTIATDQYSGREI